MDSKNTLELLKKIDRPNAKTYIKYIFNEFIELSGDRLYSDDPAIICGLAYLNNIPITVIAQLRGNNIEEQMRFNFSMLHPEGYRKSLRLMKQAEKFNRPIICFVDTIGAYPGVEAEERGQASAIANNIMEMLFLKVPIISVLIGYGCSGGALALCAADRLVILENAVLSVISPKACAEILWKDISKELEAYHLLRMNSADLYREGIIDCILPEPNNEAQTDLKEMANNIKTYLLTELIKLDKMSTFKLIKQRQRKYRLLGSNYFFD